MAKKYTTWRELFAPRIAEVLKQYPADCPERKKALRDVWPRNDERKCWPYTVYLDEIAKQTGRKPRPKPNRKSITPGHLELPLD